ncbi:MAG TPA: polysaccharide biosynthesis/export family protein [bacterium]|nr:polysaccharide biosynthesis/export family protein [bacterium]
MTSAMLLANQNVEPSGSQVHKEDYFLEPGDTLELRFFYEPDLKESEYRLKPKDSFKVVSFRNPELDREVTVRPDGRVALPLIGEITAEGLTPEEIRDHIASCYKPILKEPDVTVDVTGFQGQKTYNRTALSMSGTQTFTIRPDGKVSLQLIGELSAAGKTPAELSETILAQYEPLLKDPRATLVVTGFSIQKLYVGGEVIAPGVIPLNKFGQTTVLQAISHSGGFRETADPRSVIVIRRAPGSETVIKKLNLTAVLKGETLEDDIPLQALDVIYVPKTFIAEADKFVEQHVRQLVPVDLQAAFTYGLVKN